MAELVEAAKLFRQHKLLLSKSYRKLHRYIVEQCIESLECHRTHMIVLFRDIVIDCHRERELMTPLMSYFNSLESTGDNGRQPPLLPPRPRATRVDTRIHNYRLSAAP